MKEVPISSYALKIKNLGLRKSNLLLVIQPVSPRTISIYPWPRPRLTRALIPVRNGEERLGGWGWWGEYQKQRDQRTNINMMCFFILLWGSAIWRRTLFPLCSNRLSAILHCGNGPCIIWANLVDCRTPACRHSNDRQLIQSSGWGRCHWTSLQGFLHTFWCRAPHTSHSHSFLQHLEKKSHWKYQEGEKGVRKRDYKKCWTPPQKKYFHKN